VLKILDMLRGAVEGVEMYVMKSMAMYAREMF
jgi:hypothetical protein